MRPQFRIRTYHRFALLAVLVAPTRSEAQVKTVVSFYHGSASEGMRSEFLVPGDQHRFRAVGTRVMELRLPPKAELCVRIENAHTLNYRYSLGRTVDSAIRKIPVDGLDFILKEWPAPGKQKSASTDPSVAAAPTPVADSKRATPTDSLAQLIGVLEQDLAHAKKLVLDSDAPEELQILGKRGLSRNAGWAWVRDSVMRLHPATPGRWSDPKLRDTFEGWKKALIASSPSDSLLLKALGGYAGAVVEAVAKLKADLSAPPTATVCGSVGEGRTTFALTIAPARVDSTLKRDTGSIVDATIIVEPTFSRPRVALFPVAMGALALPKVSEFYVENGLLRERPGDRLNLRPGLVLGLNVKNFGTNEEIGVHLGAGFSSTAKLSDIRDLFVTSIISYEDKLRIGIGIGASKFPSSVKGFTVNKDFTGNISQLGDLVEEKRTVALQLLFVFPGISF